MQKLFLAITQYFTASVLHLTADNGSNHSLHSAARSPVSSYVENVFPHRSSGVLNNFSSPVRVASIGKQFGICDSNQSLNEIKFSNQCIPSFHPHSFPEYLDSSVNGSPCKISSHIADMAVSLGPKVAEGIDSRKIIKVSSNIRTMEPNAGGKLFHCPVVCLKYIFVFQATGFRWIRLSDGPTPSCAWVGLRFHHAKEPLACLKFYICCVF